MCVCACACVWGKSVHWADYLGAWTDSAPNFVFTSQCAVHSLAGTSVHDSRVYEPLTGCMAFSSRVLAF